MGKIGKLSNIVLSVLVAVGLCLNAFGIERQEEGEKPQPQPEVEKIEQEKEAVTEEQPRVSVEIGEKYLPKDISQRFVVTNIDLSGNNLISDEELLLNIPMIFNASKLPIEAAPQDSLFDLREVRAAAIEPGVEREVSVRSIQGLTQYLLRKYKSKNYAGIYIYVPEGVVVDGKLKDNTLTVNIIEASIAALGANFYDLERTEKPEGYLRRDALMKWSPVEPNKPVNEKKLDDYVNLLNRNPDRYVSAVVSGAAEPNELNLRYDVYETNPWHWFIQADNSGPKSTRWLPRIGVINTNLLGFDDKLTMIYQAHPESDFDDNWAAYGSYDFPIWGPKLRLELFGGYSEFNVLPAGGAVSFLGSGEFYGGKLRYNLFQANRWFFDLTGSWSHERSRFTPDIPLFSSLLASDVSMDLLGYGFEAYRKTDRKETELTFERVDSIDASSRSSFENARSGADPDFSIYTATAFHSMSLDENKVQRLSGSFKWIYAADRLPPSKLTVFGGMYSVRGYEEYDTLADGGVLASLQYEYDLVRQNRFDNEEDKTEYPQSLRKLAPVAFVDYGLAKVREHTAGEDKDTALVSVGPGLLAEIGQNFSAAIYYGIPLKKTVDTDKGDGRLNASILVRW
ncbi:MAG: ShlB/FhaC/HecB family hemolysin secretion/activation protein [Phycisphaerae bacterium]|nr:ShlB/FhaC/HecB family hemolysin secretion/activation protein [Phycisphaerae bacterium]